jgi:glycosyltransferase involved in cell wall biosynthesis
MTIRIAFTSIFYPLFMGRYMLEALRRRDDVEVWAAGPCTSNWIPWAGGMYLPEEYACIPDLDTGAGSPYHVNYAELEEQCPWEPDLWIEVNAGLFPNGHPRTRYAVIGTDPHVLGAHYAPIRSVVRSVGGKFFNMQTPYMEPDDIWLPYAYSPEWHTPTEIPWANRTYDASLIGLQYVNRIALFETMKSQGLKTFNELGLVFNEARNIYHNTRVGVNWSSLQDTTARVFELMAFGIVPLLNRVPDLSNIFVEGQHYLGFTSYTEAIEKMHWIIENPEEANRIVSNALEAVAPHTWDARMQTVLENMGVIP